MSDYTTVTTIADSPAHVFAAVLNARGWWNQSIYGQTTEVGDEFGFHVEGLHRILVRVVELVPGERVEWLVLENEFAFVADQTEWVGDRIVFELSPDNEGTRLTFTQHGLVPELECYDVCSNAWGFFVRESLRAFAETGIGQPESNAGDAETAERARSATDAVDAVDGASA